MAKTIPLTIPNIISAMKQAGFVTKTDLDNRLGKFGNSLRKQINDDQFEARTEFYAKMTKPELDKLGDRIDKLDNKLSAEISYLKDDVKGLTGEFATIISRSNFEKTKKSAISS